MPTTNFPRFFPCLTEDNDAYLTIPITMPKVTSAIANGLDKYLITGHDDGQLAQWDMQVSNRLIS